jgi:hypothetical protein
MPHTLLVLLSLAGWLCVVKITTLAEDEVRTTGWLLIGIGLYMFLADVRLDDARDAGLAFAAITSGGYAWYRLWGKRKLDREEAVENAAMARKHDPFCEAGVCVPHCSQNVNQKLRDARNEEERIALRKSQSNRDRAEIAAELEERRVIWEKVRAQYEAAETKHYAPALSALKGVSRLAELISLDSPAISEAATLLSVEDLEETLEQVRVLYHRHKIFVSELIHRDPFSDVKLARAEQDLTEYGAVFHALAREQRRRQSTRQ